MFYLNRVMLAGTLVVPPEVRYTREGKPVVLLKVRIPTHQKPALEGLDTKVEITVLAMGSEGKRWAEVVRAGDNVFIEGSLVQRSWKGEVGEGKEVLLWAQKIALIGGKDDGTKKGL